MEAGTKRRARERRRIYKNNMEKIESIEPQIDPKAGENSERLVDSRSKCDSDTISTENLDVSSFFSSRNDSLASVNLTYDIHENSAEFGSNKTYTTKRTEESEDNRPVPAPRKRKPTIKEPEKVSSDTDKDAVEIEIDEISLKPDPSTSDNSPKTFSVPTRNSSIEIPIPKPRGISPKVISNAKLIHQKSKSLENLKTESESPVQRTVKSDTDFRLRISTEDPLPTKVVDKKSGKEKRRIKLSGIFERMKKKTKEKPKKKKKSDEDRVPSISSSLKELEAKEKLEEDKADFFIESPRYSAAECNGKIYVQSSSGFYLVDRDVILKNENFKNCDKDRTMENSTVNTAILFQKFWSRSMIYFHGILAGFAFSHVASVTAIMHHYNYEPESFISIYSCLSFKIHFIFYLLTTLCLVSCFDRIDLGHMNLKHWKVAWKTPSMWVVLFLYLVSFTLTLSNQKTEARFDSFLRGNETEEKIWLTNEKSDIQIRLLNWYHTIWARDMIVLIAWLIISLTEFPDYLFKHLNNMVKYIKVKDKINLH